MATDPLTASLQVELAANALPWDELAMLLKTLGATGNLHSEAVAWIQYAPFRLKVAGMEALEASLAASPDPMLRRFGLAALVGLAQSPRGWERVHRDRLEAYHHDLSPLVAAAAQFTFPPEDDE